jgi:hypothetical protein
MKEHNLPVEAEFTLLKKNLVKIRRRTSVRYRCSLATLGRLFFPSTGESQDAWVQNLSDCGVGLNLNQPLEVDTAVLIRLTGTTKDVTLKLPARVAHSTREVDGSWRVGCEFQSKLNPEVLEALL